MARKLNAPMTPPMTALAARLRRKSDPPDLSRLRALVVDDDDNYRAFVNALLKRAGIATEIAEDGRRALELVRAGRHYDLLVIDYEMPRLNGLELIKLLRAEEGSEATYAIMLTARGEAETRIAALTDGFDDFLVKSSTDLELVAKIASSKRLVLRQQSADATLRELRGLACTDELTGLHNRRFFVEEAAHVLAVSELVSLVIFDLDGFKAINDTHGHLAGDQVLRDVAAVLKGDTRYEDFVVRFGGDEFVMMAHDVPLEELEEIVRRISARVAALRWESGGGTFAARITAGISTTELLQDRDLNALLDAADRDLYKNKYLKSAAEDTHSYAYATANEGALVSFPSHEQQEDKGDEARVGGEKSNV